MMMMMTMSGDHRDRAHPTVQVPPWDPFDDPAAGGPYSPYSPAGFGGNAGAGVECRYDLTALRRYLPSNDEEEEDARGPGEDGVLKCDEFRMYEFKVRKCARGRSHDWTECPYAHPGEKARRRDPRRFLYSGTACPDFRKGACKKGDSCEFAHGVFECWLHPERYRTQACKDGQSCRRRVCFFAHTPDQLRIVPTQQQQQQQHQHSPKGATDSEFGSPVRHSAAAAAFDSYFTKPWSASFVSSPTSIVTSPAPSISPPTNSPPVSPNHRGCCGSPGSMSELVACMRNMQIAKMKMSPRGQMGSLYGSPLRPGCHLAAPSTPRAESSPRYGQQLGGGLFDLWESHHHCEEEPPVERVESGRDLRAKMYAKLSKENSLDGTDLLGSGSGPDVGWVSELVK